MEPIRLFAILGIDHHYGLENVMLTEIKLAAEALAKLLSFVEMLDPALKSNPIIMDLQKALDALNSLG